MIFEFFELYHRSSSAHLGQIVAMIHFLYKYLINNNSFTPRNYFIPADFSTIPISYNGNVNP